MLEGGRDGALSNLLDKLPPNTETEDTATFGSKKAERRAVVRVSDLQGELIEIVPHTDNDGIQDGVNLMQSLHDVRVEDGENMSQPHAFEVWYDRGEFRFLLVAANERARDRFQRRISNVYPDAEVNPVDGGEAFPTIYEDDYQVGGWLEENRHTFFPIKQHSKEGFETGDPYADILGEMTTLDDSFVCLQIVFRPAKHNWTRKGPDGARVEDIAEDLRSENVEDLDSLGAWNPMRELQTRDPTKKQKEAANIVEEQIGRQGFHTNIRVFAASPQQYEAEERVRGTTGMFAKYYNSQVKQGLEPFGLERDEIDTFYRYLVNREWKDRKMILSIDELAGIAHIPNQEEVDVPGIPWRYSQTGAEAPATSPQHETETSRTRRQPSSQTDIVGKLKDPDNPTATDPQEGSLLDDVAEFSQPDDDVDRFSDEEIARQQLPTETLQHAATDFVTDIQDSDMLLINLTEDDIRGGAHTYTKEDIGKKGSIRAEADERTFFNYVLGFASEEGESLQVEFEHSSAFQEAINALEVSGPLPPTTSPTQPANGQSTGASGGQSTTHQSGASKSTEEDTHDHNHKEAGGNIGGADEQDKNQQEVKLTDPAVQQKADEIIEEYDLEPLSESELESLIAEAITDFSYETAAQQSIDDVKQAIHARKDSEDGLVDTLMESLGWGDTDPRSDLQSESAPAPDADSQSESESNTDRGSTIDVGADTIEPPSVEGTESAEAHTGSNPLWEDGSGDMSDEESEVGTSEESAGVLEETDTETETPPDSTTTTTGSIVEEALIDQPSSEDVDGTPTDSDSDQPGELSVEGDSETDSDAPPARWETEESEELEEWETEPNQIVVRRGKDGVPAALSRSGVASTVDELLTTLRRRSGFWTDRGVDDPNEITAQDVQEWIAEYVDGSGPQGSQEAQPIERAILSQIEAETDAYILSEDEQAIARQPSGVWCNASIYAANDPYTEESETGETDGGETELWESQEDADQTSTGIPTDAAALLIDCNVCDQETTHSRLVMGDYRGWECEDCGTTIEDDVAEGRYTADDGDDNEEMFGMDKVNVTRKEQLFSEYIRLLIASVPPNHRDKLSPGVKVSTLIGFIRELEKRGELMPLSDGVIENTRPDVLNPSDVVEGEQIKTPADSEIQITKDKLTETPLSALGIDPANIEGYSSIAENSPTTPSEFIGTSTQVNNMPSRTDDIQTERDNSQDSQTSEVATEIESQPGTTQAASQPQSESMRRSKAQSQPQREPPSESDSTLDSQAPAESQSTPPVTEDVSEENPPEHARQSGDEETNVAPWIDDGEGTDIEASDNSTNQ